MGHRSLRYSLTAAAFLLAADAGAQTPVFRVEVDVVPVAVTVTDGEGRFVTDLTARDFLLFENGVEQEITVFDHARTPVALTVLVDASGSMHRYLDDAKRAAEGLLRILRPIDVASVSAFNGRSRLIQEFSADPAALRAALGAIKAGGATTLYDALYIAVAQMQQFVRRTPAVTRRQVVVVLSDGRDTTSLLPLEDVLERVRESGAVVYTIRLRPLDPHPARDAHRGADEFVLRQMAETTGGRAFFVSTGRELSGAYARIARELTSQYVLAYTAAPAAERWRRIEVRVKREGSTIRTREGHVVQ